MRHFILTILVTIGFLTCLQAQVILPGAYNTKLYLPYLKNKVVAVFANNTSTIKNTHLVDSLLSNNINIKCIFAPEHGFRGAADAGEKVENGKDTKTGLPIISLYGKHNKPTPEELVGVDIMLFDIQDVGVRFYTYISSLQLYMEAAIENNIPLIILDRPNPNGFYVDGPILDMNFKSFVGMQPIPIVYGMTIGEYANMLLNEKMLSKEANEKYKGIQKLKTTNKFSLRIIPCSNYTHKSTYKLPIKPSPNLPNMQSIYLYPSLCFFEGTVISLGRGTTAPFQLYGHPTFSQKHFSFTPTSMAGAKEPPLKDERCYGEDLTKVPTGNYINLTYLIKAYKQFADKENFFLVTQKNDSTHTRYFFNKLAGNSILMKQLQQQVSYTEIKKSWQPGIKAFKKIRKKYLLYPDFE